MEPAEIRFIVALALANVILGLALALHLARLLARATGRTGKGYRYLAALGGIYFLECVAFPVGMATQRVYA